MARILLVDDNAIVRRSLRQVFEAIGWEVREAENGVRAIEEAERFRPNVVVLDLQMPEVNGLETALALRLMVPRPHSILFTLYGDTLGPDEAKLSGISAVCSKSAPVTALVKQAEGLVSAAA